MNTPTPRTDAALEWVRPAGSDCGPPNEQYVSADFARTLELELAAAAARAADWARIVDDRNAQLAHEREKVRVLRSAIEELIKGIRQLADECNRQ